MLENLTSVHWGAAFAMLLLIPLQIASATLMVLLLVKRNWKTLRNVGVWYFIGTASILIAWFADWALGQKNRVSPLLILAGNIVAGILPIRWIKQVRRA